MQRGRLGSAQGSAPGTAHGGAGRSVPTIAPWLCGPGRWPSSGASPFHNDATPRARVQRGGREGARPAPGTGSVTRSTRQVCRLRVTGAGHVVGGWLRSEQGTRARTAVRRQAQRGRQGSLGTESCHGASAQQAGGGPVPARQGDPPLRPGSVEQDTQAFCWRPGERAESEGAQQGLGRAARGLWQRRRAEGGSWPGCTRGTLKGLLGVPSLAAGGWPEGNGGPTQCPHTPTPVMTVAFLRAEPPGPATSRRSHL